MGQISLKSPYEIIENLVSSRSLEKYAFIMNTIQSTNIATDRELQKRFTGFYRVRRNVEWQAVFYQLLEDSKGLVPSFEAIITTIYQKTGRIEASFSSKLLATLNPNMPIWDSLVLEYLGLKLKGIKKEVRLQNAIALYDSIVQWYAEQISSNTYKDYLDVFNQMLPQYKWFSDTKKLDFIIWGSGRINE